MPRVAPDSNDIVVWKFDDTGAPFVNSSTVISPGSFANLTVLSSISYFGSPNPRLRVEGPFGAGSFGIEFQGTQNGSPRCFISGANAFYPTLPMTLSGWVYLRQWDSSFTQHFMQKQKTIGVWSGPFAVQMIQNQRFLGNTSGELEFSTNANSIGTTFVRTDKTQPVPLDQWSHMGWAYDGTTLNCYINGVLVGSVTTSPPAVVFSYDTSNPGPWFVGAIPSGSGAPEEPFCSLADWRIANIMRPGSYFANIYQQGQLDWTGNATGSGVNFIPRITYYKLRASCSSAPNGYIVWINTTGDDTGKPSCAGSLGPSIVIGKWEV